METYCYKTSEYKHKAFTVPAPWNERLKVTYYIASVPNNQFLIHCHMPWYEDGYGGGVLDFLMDDGSIKKIKGPFYEYVGSHNHIFEKTGIKVLAERERSNE